MLVLKQNVRYMAYSSDVGEALRLIVQPSYVKAAYAISWLYVGGDVAYETYKEKKRGSDRLVVLRTALSRTVFQTLASIVFPALTIHTVVSSTKPLFKYIGKYQKWGPTSVGFAVIPLLPFMFDHPVEHAVDYVFNCVWPVKEVHIHEE